MVWGLTFRNAKDTYRQKLQNFFSQFKLQNFFAILERYCQSLGLDNILLHFYSLTSQNINFVMVRQYFLIIIFLSHQPSLKFI